MSNKILNVFLILSLIYKALSQSQLEQEDVNTINNVYEEEIKRIKGLYSKENSPSLFDRDIHLFLPKFDFQRPDVYKKEAYSKIYRYSSDHAKKTESLKDAFIFPEDILEENEVQYKKKILNSLIKKEVSLDEGEYSENYEVYGYPEAKRFEIDEPKYVKLSNGKTRMKDFAEISNFISFEPKDVQILEKPICIPTMTLFNVKNTMNENLIIRSIKSDLYQVTIFYFRPGKDSNQSYNQKNIYPKTLQPGESMLFQLIILPDMIGKIKGNIYLEFNDNKLVVYPLVILGTENIYRVQPVYYPNWQGSKLLQTPISIYNPHPKTLIVKEVINSFSSINLVWPNGQSVSSNHTSISSSMLEIPPKASKNLMMINFYKEVAGVEYGLLQMKTDKDTLIIPVLIRVEIQGIKLFPTYFNFGLVDLNQNIKRLIPLSISNMSKNPIQIKLIYTEFDDSFIQYVPDLNSIICPVNFNNKKSQSVNSLNTLMQNSYNPNLCVIPAGETLQKFGYLMLDPTMYNPESDDSHLYKKLKSSIIIHSNFTENPFLEIPYEYYLDKNTINLIDPKQNDLLFQTGPHSRASYKYEIQTKIKAPFTFNISSSKLVYLEDPKSNSLTDLDTIQIIPESNQITSRFQESNDNLKLSIVLDNPSSFVNKKHYFYPVKTNFNMVTLIPVKFYDRSIDLHYCDQNPTYRDCLNENFSIFKSVNFKNTVINVDYGIVSTTDTAMKYFSLFNDNNEMMSIEDVETTKGNLLLAIESVEDIFSGEKIPSLNAGKSILTDPQNLPKLLKNKFMQTEKEIIKIPLIQNSYTTFSILVSSPIETDLSGSLILTFSNNYKVTINVISKFLKGNLNISPSVIRFEPAFPGYYQTKLVSSKSSFNIPINIHSVKSQDQRIIPTLLTNSIISNNRTEILKVTFDPSKVALEENFMKGGEYFTNGTSKYLTYKELYLWKEKQKLWELLGSQGRTEINTSVKIKTNIQSETVNVRAFLTKPSLVKKDEIDFGLIQLGESQARYIEVFNPSDEIMLIQVLLASEEFGDIYNNTMFTRNKKFRFSPDNQVTLLDCYFFNTTHFDPLNTNTSQNIISHKNHQRKKRKVIDEDIGLDPYNSIIVEEEIPNFLNSKNISKVELLKKIFLYANPNIKTNFVQTERLVCNSNHMSKNEILLNNYKELAEKIFSDEFNKEIPVVKRMTEKSQPSGLKKESRNEQIGFFENIAQFLKIFFKTESAPKRKKVEEDKINQEFFLPKIVSGQVYSIKPHQRLKIGPINFYPTTLSNNSATLFIKNNLTMLYPIKLRGTGGSGTLNFTLLETDLEGGVREQQIDNKLLFEINSLQENSEVVTKTLLLKNTGNLAVKVYNISIESLGCEAYGIKISKCDSLYLKPDESYRLEITVKPDYNFYFVEKEIHFETQNQIIVLKVSVNISNELLSLKNRLFNFDYLKNYGYISVFVVMFIISVILYILSVEWAEISYRQPERSLQFFSSKEIIENNPILKFENLFIKAYRKFNQGFYDDFVQKQIDKPGTGTSYDENMLEKKKSGKFPRKSEESVLPEKEMNINMIDSGASINNLQTKQTKKETQKKKETTSSNQSLNKKPATTNTTTNTTTTTSTKKPIGMAIKTEKKEEETQPTSGAGLNIVLKKSDHPNKYDTSCTFNSYNKYANPYFSKDEYHPAQTHPENPEASLNNPNNATNPNEYSIYSQAYWPKNYNYYTKPGFQQRYDYTRGQFNNTNYYNATNNQFYNYANKVVNPNQNLTTTPNIANQNSFNSQSNSSALNLNATSFKPSYIKTNGNQESQDKIPTSQNEHTVNNQDFSKDEKESQNSSNITNIKDQFMAFDPEFFKRSHTNEISDSKSEKKEDTHETPSENVQESFKSNFDFTNIFTKPEEKEASEPEEKNINEEEESSQHYQSEKEKLMDSGAEDLKFNFNSIFNQNNMKFTMNYNNDYTDNEDLQPKDGNKPYFDKNLFVSFDSAFNKSNLFTSDPFAANGTKKSLLSELRDEDDENMRDDMSHKSKLDEVAENEDEDDEEDPLWNDENLDVNKEGFFDETGTYKLKQMDFNFDLDFGKMKKL